MSGKIPPGANRALRKAAGKTVTRYAGKAAKTIVQNIDPLEVLREYFACKRATESEVTRREEIKAKRDTAVGAIQSQRELIEKYFELRFAERASALSKLFDLLENAISTKSNTELDTALNGILGVVQDSPLKDFDSFRSARIEGQIIEI